MSAADLPKSGDTVTKAARGAVRPTRPPMKLAGLNTLFGRLAALVILVLLVPHFAWYALVNMERREMRSHYAVEESRFLIEAVEQHVARGSTEPLPWRLRTVPVGSASVPNEDPHPPDGLNAFRHQLAARLPPGTILRLPAHEALHEPQIWILTPGQANWIVMAIHAMPPPRPPGDSMVIWLICSFSAAVLLAVLAAWRLQQPIRKLSTAAGRFGKGKDVPPLEEEGPLEFRMLTRRFNQMVSDISQNESDRGIMLAGVAHDLKAPLARLRLRAEMVDETRQRDGFVRDIDSLTHIVEQFLVFAHDAADQSPKEGVDGYCERFARNYRTAWPLREPLRLSLHAGSEFALSAATLDRLLTNLVENAYQYGKPPVTITTGRIDEKWFVAVDDQGAGIAAAQIENASRPFVRLDPARGGNAHCGLGLAIVERLASRAGGECHVANVDGAGLRVEMRFPKV